RRSDIADKAEYLLLVVELFHRVGSAGRFVAVIRRDQLEHPAFHATRVVDPAESGVDPKFHLTTEFFGRTGKRSDHSEPDFAGGDAARGRRGKGLRHRRRGRGGGSRRGRRNHGGERGRGRRRFAGQRLFEIRKLALRQFAIGAARGHRTA